MKEHNEKQAIEEMAAVIGSAIEFDELDFGMEEKTEIIAMKAAEKFYAEGYRKQSEGEWIEHGNWAGSIEYKCTACKETTFHAQHYAFCPNCGAYMKGATDERAD